MAGSDPHQSLGRQFRTPAHPDVLTALGRTVFSFLSLEEMVTAIAYDAGHCSLSAMRAKMAGDKELALKALARRYRRVEGGPRVAQSLFAAAKAFGRARRSIRNELFHAHPFTAGVDEEGAYLPGLGHTARDGRSFRTLARTPSDLLDLSEAVEQAIDSLAYARTLVRARPLGPVQNG